MTDHGGDRVAELERFVRIGRQFRVDADEVAVCGHDEEVRDRRFQDGIEDRSVACQDVEGRLEALLDVDAEAGRSVALGIEIENENALADGRQRGAKIDRGRRLADAALLIGDSNDTRPSARAARA